MIVIYQYLLSSIRQEYETVKVLKDGERGSVVLLRHRRIFIPWVY